MLKLVELEAARKRLIKTYSKGMQQRVGLAQALINNPDLLILDEPTSGLTPLGRMKVREIIQRLKNRAKPFSSPPTNWAKSRRLRPCRHSPSRPAASGGARGRLVKQYQCDLEHVFLKVIGYQPNPEMNPQMYFNLAGARKAIRRRAPFRKV